MNGNETRLTAISTPRKCCPDASDTASRFRLERSVHLMARWTTRPLDCGAGG